MGMMPGMSGMPSMDYGMPPMDAWGGMAAAWPTPGPHLAPFACMPGAVLPSGVRHTGVVKAEKSLVFLVSVAFGGLEPRQRLWLPQRRGLSGARDQ